jgi:hypothetical protein
MWRRLVVRYRLFGDNIFFLCSGVKQSKKSVKSKCMRYHIGESLGSFVFAGNVRDPARLLDPKVVISTWGNENAQKEGETAEQTRKK